MLFVLLDNDDSCIFEDASEEATLRIEYVSPWTDQRCNIRLLSLPRSPCCTTLRVSDLRNQLAFPARGRSMNVIIIHVLRLNCMLVG